MNQIIGMIFFLGIVILILFFMHAYCYRRLFYLFHLPRLFIAYIGVFLISLIFPVVTIMERLFNGSFWRFAYTLASIWIGVIFLLFCLLLLQHLLSLVLDLNRLISGIVILATLFLLSTYGLANTSFLNVKEVEIEMPYLEKDITVVQLSDIHVGTIRNSEFLEEIVKETNALNPDMVFITGDLVDGSGKLHQESFSALKDLRAKTFFVTGNHETYEDLDEVLSWISANNVTVLRNEVVNYKDLQIVGMDNPSSDINRSKVNLSGMNIEKNKPTILLHHVPIDLSEVQGKGIDLVLSGHTHNGQIFPFNLIVKLFFSNVNGLYEFEDTKLYVSPGTGTWGPPMRIGSQNEITLLKLKSE